MFKPNSVQIKRALAALACLALFAVLSAESSGCEEVEKSEKSSAQVTPEKIKQVKIGDTRREVRKLLGKPEDTQRQESEFGVSDCWYYGVLAEKSWQLCFDDGKLTSKNRW